MGRAKIRIIVKTGSTYPLTEHRGEPFSLSIGRDVVEASNFLKMKYLCNFENIYPVIVDFGGRCLTFKFNDLSSVSDIYFCESLTSQSRH